MGQNSWEPAVARLYNAHEPLNLTEHTGSIWTQADEPAGGSHVHWSHVQWKGPLEGLGNFKAIKSKLLHSQLEGNLQAPNYSVLF